MKMRLGDLFSVSSEGAKEPTVTVPAMDPGHVILSKSDAPPSNLPVIARALLEGDVSQADRECLSPAEAEAAALLSLVGDDLRAGRGARDGASKGGRMRRISRPTPDQLRSEVQAERVLYPKISRREACQRVGKRHGVSGSTVEKDLRD